MEQNEKEKLVFVQDEKLKAPRFHYDGWHVLDDGKTVEIFVSTPDKQLGKIVLPWEEIARIRKCGWECKEKVAEKVMRGKRVHCRHLKSWHTLFPASCQIGKDAGPHYVNCITCKYIDGYIEEYDPDKEHEKVSIKLTGKETWISRPVDVQGLTQPDYHSADADVFGGQRQETVEMRENKDQFHD